MFVALKTNGEVITWGERPVLNAITVPDFSSEVLEIVRTSDAYAALLLDGSVRTWGNPIGGGDSSSVAAELKKNVISVTSNDSAFVALKADGSIVCWGKRDEGGSTSGTGNTLTSGVIKVFGGTFGFVALKADGTVVPWGIWSKRKVITFQNENDQRGTITSNLPTGTVNNIVPLMFGAFASIYTDGRVSIWNIDSFNATNWDLLGQLVNRDGSQFLYGKIIARSSTGTLLAAHGVNWGLTSDRVVGGTGNYWAQALLNSDGSVTCYGNIFYGGSAGTYTSDGVFVSIKDKLQGGVIEIVSNQMAFAALKFDGSVITWGSSFYGGDYSQLTKGLQSGVKHIYATSTAFAALKEDGSVITWGSALDGGYSNSVQSNLQNGVIELFNYDGAEGIVYNAINIVVSQEYAIEDSGQSLIFTFTRTGSTTDSLNVNYSIAGTADGSDYVGATPGSGKIITFATGSAKATLAIDPTADRTLELDETVVLNLATGSGYTIGTSTAVAGTISDDDKLIPQYTLTPSATSINEGATLTTSVATTNVATGTTLYYALSGTRITTADFSAGALTGEGITDATGEFTFTHTLAIDQLTEVSESLEIKLYSDAARTLQVGATALVSIADTSVNHFNFDIDGDGKVTALGDGLMVIRKLFGFAFAGDSLTNKAISPTAIRTTAEIHQFIESGISTGMLDVDKDGKTTALGDGLMIIRHLFGAAFAGEALTNKAISPASPYFGPPVDHLTIANTIDSMKLIPALST